MIWMCLFFLWSDQSPISLEDLELFKPLKQEQVAMTADGGIFLLDTEENVVRTYKADGTPGATFGGKGEGPGEFTSPMGLHIVNGFVGVEDFEYISLFEHDGTFLGRNPASWGKRVITQKGVIHTDTPFARGLTDDIPPAHIYGYSHELKEEEKVTLGTWNRPDKNFRTWAIMSEGKIQLHYNPTPDDQYMEVNGDGSRVFLYTTNATEILVFDGATHKALPSISLPQPKMIKEAWSDQHVEARKEKMLSNPRVKEVKVHLSERFPAMRYMNYIDDTLYVVLWGENPDKVYPVLAFSDDGKKVEPKYSAQAVKQIVGLYQDTAWVVTWDKDEEMAGIERLPLSEVERTAKEKPLAWDD